MGAGHGVARQGKAWLGAAWPGSAWLGMDNDELVRSGVRSPVVVSPFTGGLAGQGKAWSGMARHGMARWGRVWVPLMAALRPYGASLLLSSEGSCGVAWPGMAWQGEARRGLARRGPAGTPSRGGADLVIAIWVRFPDGAWLIPQGWAYGTARQGTARRGRARQGMVRRGMAWQGLQLEQPSLVT